MDSEKVEYKRHWRCKVCGEHSPISANYCCNPQCGADLGLHGEVEFESKKPKRPPDDPVGRKKRWIGPVIAAVCLLLILIPCIIRLVNQEEPLMHSFEPTGDTAPQAAGTTEQTVPEPTEPSNMLPTEAEPTPATVPVTEPLPTRETEAETSAPTTEQLLTQKTEPETSAPTTDPFPEPEELAILGGTYVGSVRDGKADGEGTLTWQEGIYTGKFEDGYPYGEGTFQFRDGTEVQSDLWSYGTGSYRYPTGKLESNVAGTYTGMKKDGEFCGYGQLKLDYGSSYQGSFFNGHPWGSGAYSYKSGMTVTGVWDWSRSDQASLDPDRAGTTMYYTGMTCDGDFYGFGTLTLDKCGTFYGDFYEGHVNGGGLYAYQRYTSESDAIRYGDRWTMVHSQYSSEFEHTYTGLVLNGSWEGFGMGITLSDYHYVGEIKDNFRHGYGRLYKPDNTVYQEGVFIWGYVEK